MRRSLLLGAAAGVLLPAALARGQAFGDGVGLDDIRAGMGRGSGSVNTTGWNPSDKTANMTLSNSNLTATASSATAGVRASPGHNSGKYYWEYTVGSSWGNNDSAGVGTAAASLTGNFANNALAAGILMSGTTGSIYVANAYQSASINPISPGSVVGIAVDLTGQLIWMRVAPSGNWNGSGTASPGGTGGFSLSALSGAALYPQMFLGTSGDSTIANFGASSFSGAVPSGFTAGWV